MTLSRYDVIQINATIIVGLIILLTFQSLTSSFVEEKINSFFTMFDEITIKQTKISDLLLKCEQNHYFNETNLDVKFQDRCDELEIESMELESEREGIAYIGGYYGLINRNEEYSEYVINLWYAPLYLNIANLIMILPFTVSAVIESIFAIRKMGQDDASKLGVAIMLVGFIVIAVGFISMVLITEYFSQPFTKVVDTDLDYLYDHDEKTLGTDPNKEDTDGDGLLDGDEVDIYETDPLNTDTDGDGVSDGDEAFTFYTDPLITDTDGDGISDMEEVEPYLDDPYRDTDGDGLGDGEEVAAQNTDPLNTDTDGDGVSDGDEVLKYETDPLN